MAADVLYHPRAMMGQGWEFIHRGIEWMNVVVGMIQCKTEAAVTISFNDDTLFKVGILR